VTGPVYYREYAPSADGRRLRSPGVPDVVLYEAPPPPPPPTATSRSVLVKARGYSTYTDVVSPTTRDLLVYGKDRPTYSTAGALDRSLIAANPVNGQTVLSGAGTSAASPGLISNKWYRGQVKVTGGYYDFSNCQFNADPVTVGPALDVQGANIGRVRVYDSDFWPQNPQWNTPAVYGWRTELYRCYIRGCTDGYAHVGIGKDGTNGTGGGANYTGVYQGVILKGNLVELMAYKSPDPGAAGGLTDNSSHLDAMLQTRGGDGIDVQGNLVLAYCDPNIGEGGFHPALKMPSGTLLKGQKYSTASARMLGTTSWMMCSPIHGQFSNLKFRDNWGDGGAVIINFAGHTSAAGTIEITGNRVGRDHRVGATAFWLANPALPLSISGNVEMTTDRTGRPLGDRDFSTAADTFTVTTTAANARTNGA
jgi:hypothetical protein